MPQALFVDQSEGAAMTRHHQSFHAMALNSIVDDVNRPVIHRGVVENGKVAIALPIGLATEMVEDTSVLADHEQLRIGLAEVKHREVHRIAPAANATRAISPASTATSQFSL